MIDIRALWAVDIACLGCGVEIKSLSACCANCGRCARFTIVNTVSADISERKGGVGACSDTVSLKKEP
jgi:hypothetical protein